MDDMNEPLLAYVCIEEFENGQALRGAALVTDAATEPVEFRCTSAIRPTLLQRTLWGKRLDGYIASRLVGKPLLDALSNAVALVVVPSVPIMDETTASLVITVEGKEVEQEWRKQGCWE